MAHRAPMAAHFDGASGQPGIMRAHGIGIALHRKETPNRETTGHQTSCASNAPKGGWSSWVFFRSSVPSGMPGRAQETDEVAERVSIPSAAQNAQDESTSWDDRAKYDNPSTAAKILPTQLE